MKRPEAYRCQGRAVRGIALKESGMTHLLQKPAPSSDAQHSDRPLHRAPRTTRITRASRVVCSRRLSTPRLASQ
eukprot:6176190-Pleurochrysis_carterae.AAC.3